VSAQIVQVIWTNGETRGKGTEDNMVRRICQLWTLEGVLICEYDHGPTEGSQTMTVNYGPLAALGQSGGTT
jgi:hypothetical protein